MEDRGMPLPVEFKPSTSRNAGKKSKEADFSKIGGLAHHVQTLQNLIILPLIHGNIYTHFNIKPPKGVLFYGPPGTGKTLVASALATELSKQGFGKVSFFHRKGADVLDKWVGESERKLREIFEKAAKSRPAVIFFDEIDGLAPARSGKNDHVHCSVVATLLALMDGLDNSSGVIVIGATNRIESLDPALRRPGRFDKELYFPLPTTEGRLEILQVHTQSWKHKPSPEFLRYMAEVTSGFCGSDLQALCAEAVWCCTKRIYPNIEKSVYGYKIRVDLNKLLVEECDFLNARINITPSSQKQGSKRRKLSHIIQPLLQKQIDNILCHIKLMWPHFLQHEYKYELGKQRYAGRMILTGTYKHGLNTHIIPDLLQHLEHLPILDIPGIFEKDVQNVCYSLPSLLLLLKVDEWWHIVDSSTQNSITSALEDIHNGLPILVITTCKSELPEMLSDFFDSAITIVIQDPDVSERKEFFAPLFFSETLPSVYRILLSERNRINYPIEVPHKRNLRHRGKGCNRLRGGYCLRLRGGGGKRTKKRSTARRRHLEKVCRDIYFKRIKQEPGCTNETVEFVPVFGSKEQKFQGQSLCKQKKLNVISDMVQDGLLKLPSERIIKREPSEIIPADNFVDKFFDSSDLDKRKIYDLWSRTSQATTEGMSLIRLENVYDAIFLCINMNKNSFGVVVKNIEEILMKFESVR